MRRRQVTAIRCDVARRYSMATNSRSRSASPLSRMSGDLLQQLAAAVHRLGGGEGAGLGQLAADGDAAEQLVEIGRRPAGEQLGMAVAIDLGDGRVGRPVERRGCRRAGRETARRPRRPARRRTCGACGRAAASRPASGCARSARRAPWRPPRRPASGPAGPSAAARWRRAACGPRRRRPRRSLGSLESP